MIGDRDVLVVYDERMLGHRPEAQEPFLPSRLNKRLKGLLEGLGLQATWSYPEHPGRITAVYELLQSQPVPGVRFEPGVAATEAQLASVHTLSYIRDIYELRGKQAWLDIDTTAVSAGSVEAAEVAAGSGIAAVDALFEKRADAAFVLCRPPGHHANAVRARGFCLFNNIAVAAAHAESRWGCERILIIDWDAHHGNGTQEIFTANSSVLFFDTHRAAPFYPGTGALTETGEGLGEGTTINVPLPEQTGDRAILKAFNDILVPAAEWFKPDLVLVSAGMDGHHTELCLNMSFNGFSAMTGVVQRIADRYCDGRLVMMLEGGYNPATLAQATRTVLEVMAGAEPATADDPGMPEVTHAVEYHRDAFQEAGESGDDPDTR